MKALSQIPLAKRLQAGLLMAVVAVSIAIPGRALLPARAKAHGVLGPVQVGTSFSPRHAEELGLDYKDAFKRLEAMHFKVIRVSAYWDEIDDSGYERLDWLVNEAAESHQPIALSVGMKGLGWPEFYIPPGYEPQGLPDGHNVAEDAALQRPLLLFIHDTVARYRGNPSLVAWQVENEPFNRSGPHRWWIGASLLSAEIRAVKELDRRPLIVNVFGHFNMLLDQASSRNGLDLKSIFGLDVDAAERDSLSVLAKNDILGLDVYTGIGYSFLGQEHVSRAGSDWSDQVGRWRTVARRQQKQAWVTEAQAEPWEASSLTYATPKSITPAEIQNTFQDLKEEGYSTVLLWGAEYWLWRSDQGDSRWLESVEKVLRSEAKAPAINRS